MKMPYWLVLGPVILLGCLTLPAQEPASKPDSSKAPAPGTYQIRNQKYHDLLRPRDANHADGTRIVLYSPEPWKCMTWRLRPEAESGFRVQNLFTSKTFTVKENGEGAGVAIIQVPAGPSGPAWQFTPLKDGSYKITDAKSGKALTATKAGTDSEVGITIEPWGDAAEQKWELQRIDPKQLTM